MAAAKYDPETYVNFKNQGWSNYQIAAHLGVDESSVRRGLRAIDFKEYQIPTDVLDRLNILLDKPIFLSDDDVMITADWHIPLYDPAYANEMIETARELNLSKLVVAGDFFNFDALSRFDPKQDSAGLEAELDEATTVMRILLETFDQVYYLWGNHDARLHRTLGFKMEFKRAMTMIFDELGKEALDQLVISNLDHMLIETSVSEWPWYICHPQNYAQVPLGTARKLAAKQNAHIITAHAHHFAAGYAPDGKRIICDAGGLFDKNSTAYLQRSTTYPTWCQGYVYLKDGRFNATSPGVPSVGIG